MHSGGARGEVVPVHRDMGFCLGQEQMGRWGLERERERIGMKSDEAPLTGLETLREKERGENFV